MSSQYRRLSSFLIDCIATFTLVGIWARFIEPKRLKQTSLTLTLDDFPLQPLKIAHLSDLHFHAQVSTSYLKKIVRQLKKEQPDLIVFTGDFICYSMLEDKARLKNFLCQFEAPLGCFCTYGNHDYEKYVSRTKSGDYDILQAVNPLKGLWMGLKTLFTKKCVTKGSVTTRAKELEPHQELAALLKETPFQLLENQTITLSDRFNIVGLGDYALGKCLPHIAFKDYNAKLPGIILSHNPDTFPLLQPYPGQLVLSGHTHGEQIHMPYPAFLRKITQKLTRLENSNHSRGHYTIDDKHLYVNRGLGCHKPIRLFSPPEILMLTLQGRLR